MALEQGTRIDDDGAGWYGVGAHDPRGTVESLRVAIHNVRVAPGDPMHLHRSSTSSQPGPHAPVMQQPGQPPLAGLLLSTHTSREHDMNTNFGSAKTEKGAGR